MTLRLSCRLADDPQSHYYTGALKCLDPEGSRFLGLSKKPLAVLTLALLVLGLGGTLTPARCGSRSDGTTTTAAQSPTTVAASATPPRPPQQRSMAISLSVRPATGGSAMTGYGAEIGSGKGRRRCQSQRWRHSRQRAPQAPPQVGRRSECVGVTNVQPTGSMSSQKRVLMFPDESSTWDRFVPWGPRRASHERRLARLNGRWTRSA